MTYFYYNIHYYTVIYITISLYWPLQDWAAVVWCIAVMDQLYTWEIVWSTGINITVGHRPLAEQNADMAVHRLLCHTDIMADRFVSSIWIFSPLLLQIFLTKSVIFNTCIQRFCLLDNHRIWLRPDPHNNNVILCVKRNILYYIYCYWV
jgi:hypothetical protein